MNIEVLTAEIKHNESHTFTFSKPVTQYMVGFSKFILQYKPPDHHVKKINIDLSDCKQSGNDVTVKPILILEDTSKKTKPGENVIKVVVIAAVGDGNQSVHLHDGVNANFESSLSSENADIKSALFSTTVQFNDSDHHLSKYQSAIIPSLEANNKYALAGNVTIKDKSINNTGQVRGSVFIYDKSDKRIICQDFDSNKTSCFGPLFLDNVPQDINLDDYQVACFINGFQVSFADGEDHHVLKMDVSAELPENKLIQKDGRTAVIMKLNAFLTDNGKNQFNTPHNVVTGFVVAFNNKQ